METGLNEWGRGDILRVKDVSNGLRKGFEWFARVW